MSTSQDVIWRRWALASVTISALFYSVFFVCFCASTYLMMRRRARLQTDGHSMLRDPFVVSGFLFFTTVTGNWAAAVDDSLQAFIYVEHGVSPEAYYTGTEKANLVRIGFWLATILIADIFLVYRLHIIWSPYKYISVIPCASLLTSFALAVRILVRLPTTTSLISHGNMVLIKACWLCSLCTNCVCCILIIWRLYHASSRTVTALTRSHQSGVIRAFLIFIESAVLFVGAEIIFMALYASGSRSDASFLIGVIWPILTGIAFMLINIRVGMGYTVQTRRVGGVSTMSFGIGPSGMPPPTNVTEGEFSGE